MVTGALSSPKARSGIASGFIKSDTGTFSASAPLGNGGSANAPSATVASAMVAVLLQNSRRVMCN